MQNSHPFVSNANALLEKLDAEGSINTAIDLANELLNLLGVANNKSAEEVFESSIELPNAERYDSWFQPHPIFKSDRACFDLADGNLFQAKFYWLKKHSRQIIAGGVHFTPNFEDEDFTHNERYKVGVDFFLSPNGKSLQVVLSNRGNLRIVELNKRLNSTQADIFTKWEGAGNLSTQEALHTTLWESFKLKSVNQKFYDGVSNSFTDLLQHLKEIGKDEEEAKLFASRLLGRLLFCWFLRKKGVINEGIGYFDAKGIDATEYYRSNLERLFFLTLNTPIDDRDELQKQHQRQLFSEISEEKQSSLFKTDQKTPYLNGGLFQPHIDNDWFKDASLTFPDGYFVNLYSHFDEFNFTTDESSPEYEQIAIDPEMLGRVFESLLATQIDETGQQAHKAKGTFYTPREIVSYMCRESLRNYLYNAVTNDENIKQSIDSILDISDSEWAKSKSNILRDKVKDYRAQIIDALDAVTVLDPACGSGAFPMGMLQLCFKTYERLEGRFDPYKTKLQIIQNNIFGVDIEPMAVEIARLRTWLSLIVDEEDSRNVEPLPNLDFKFVCANSLISLNEELGLFSDAHLHQKLKDIRSKYFNARKPHTKKALQDEYYKLTSSEQVTIIADDARTTQLKSFDPFRNSHPAEFFDTDQMFGVGSGFDIVIANPPYIKERDNRHSFKQVNESAIGKKYHQGKMDFWFYFLHRSVYLVKPKGVITFITSRYWLSSSGSRKLIRHISEELSFIDFVDIGKLKVFDNVAGHHMIAVYSKRKDIDVFPYKMLSNDVGDINSRSDNENKKTFSLSNRKIITGDYSIVLDEDLISYEGMHPLGSLATISQGVVQNPDKISSKIGAKYDLPVGMGVFVLSKDEIDQLHFSEDEEKFIKPFYKENAISSYRLDAQKKPSYLLYLTKQNCVDIEKFPNLLNHLVKFKAVMDARRETQSGSIKWYQMHWPRKQEYFEQPKIVIPGMFAEPKAAFIEGPAYFGLSSNIITGLARKEDYFAILGIINSKFAQYWFTKHGKMRGAGVDVGVDKLRSFPIPELNNELATELGISTKSAFESAVYDKAEIDKIVYRLYGFSPEEIKIVEMGLE